jgi:RNA polymerase sigma factor (sigma-70 family)
LRRHAYLHHQGNADVDDVFQEAVLRLLDPQCRAELRVAGGSILPWLSRWGYWRLDDAARRKQDPLSDAVPKPADPPADDQLSAAEVAVQRAFPLLSPRDRLILRMRYEERMTTEQVAEQLGISIAAAKKAAHDARERLRNHLKKASIHFQ